MRLTLAVVLILALSCTGAWAAEQDTAAVEAKGRQVVTKGLAWLKSRQKANASFTSSDREPPAITALVLRALVNDPQHGAKSDAAQKAIKSLTDLQQADGGFYKDMLANYNTAIAISALAAAKDPALQERIDRAVRYLKGAQVTDAVAGPGGEKIDPNHAFFGGWNYGGQQGGRPDLSNAAIALEALKDSGLKQDDPAYQNALKFVTRLQNSSESNPAPWAGNDGGFVYGPGRSGEGDSAAGEYTSPDGKKLLRSYGSMTYAGLKSMVYAGLSKNDPPVKAAWDWVRSNWTLDEHPGLKANGPDAARDGIFYYYHTLARALDVYDEPTITDTQGRRHDWRVELIDKLASIQRQDGSFAGTKRWMEDNPVISTAFAVLAAEEALKDLREHQGAR
jgi:squalene-hopene/tetraprenyl-beta-curcumene cyclase